VVIEAEGHRSVRHCFVPKNRLNQFADTPEVGDAYTWLSGRLITKPWGERSSFSLAKSQSLAAKPPTRNTDCVKISHPVARVRVGESR